MLCGEKFNNSGRAVEAVKYPTDNRTYVSVLNVNCSVFPYDTAHECRQIALVPKALAAVVRATP